MHSAQCTLHSLLCRVPRAPRAKPGPLRPTRPSPLGQGGVSAVSAAADPGLPGLDGERAPCASRTARRPAGDPDPTGRPRARAVSAPHGQCRLTLACTVGCAAVHCPLCIRGISSNRKTSGLVRRREIAGVHTGVCSRPPGRQRDSRSESPQRTWSFRRRPRSGTRRAPQPGPEKDRSRDATGRDRRCAGFHHSPPPPHA
jgi:hypothetical protein